MKLLQFTKYYIKSKFLPVRNEQLAIRLKNNGEKFYNRIWLNAEESNRLIKNAILNSNPFMAARYGSTELVMMRNVEFGLKSKSIESLQQLIKWSGFFPNDIKLAYKFVQLMRESSSQCDLFAPWFCAFEEYFINTYMNKNIQCTYLFNLEPWTNPDNPWSAALRGKKVLVIHPFEDTIKAQYSRRELIFPNTNILPVFELKTLKAVQTIGGEKDSRFGSWFDALDWMYNQAISIDFDVAIIGCGAYGFPLAAKLKQYGKQVIHLAGATQLLFGIRGKRWDKVPDKSYVRKLYNNAWVYPLDQDKPQNAGEVEDGCYWN